MKNIIRKLALYVLVMMPIASVSFAAQSALNMDRSRIIDESQIPHGGCESSRY